MKAKYVIVFLIAIGIAGYYTLVRQGEPGPTMLLSERATVTIGSARFTAEVARSDEDRVRGLSGRARLDAGRGMLFIFETAEIRSFWMKDMNFPIDIIWISGGKVADITRDLPAPKGSIPAAAQPAIPSETVLEVNSGEAQANGIRVGDIVEIDFNRAQ
jgi:uncharacterized membrane protein (UPF0127 family)